MLKTCTHHAYPLYPCNYNLSWIKRKIQRENWVKIELYHHLKNLRHSTDFNYFTSFLNLSWGRRGLALITSSSTCFLPSPKSFHKCVILWYFIQICTFGKTVNKSIKCRVDRIGDKNNSKNSCLPFCFCSPSNDARCL